MEVPPCRRDRGRPRVRCTPEQITASNTAYARKYRQKQRVIRAQAQQLFHQLDPQTASEVREEKDARRTLLNLVTMVLENKVSPKKNGGGMRTLRPFKGKAASAPVGEVPDGSRVQGPAASSVFGVLPSEPGACQGKSLLAFASSRRHPEPEQDSGSEIP